MEEAQHTPKTVRDYAREMSAKGMGCNCNLDRWQPEQTTGHSWVCRIHKAAMLAAREAR